MKIWEQVNGRIYDKSGIPHFFKSPLSQNEPWLIKMLLMHSLILLLVSQTSYLIMKNFLSPLHFQDSRSQIYKNGYKHVNSLSPTPKFM